MNGGHKSELVAAAITCINGFLDSCDHGQLRAGVLVLEKPMAHIDSEVDLFALYDFEFALVLLHVDGDEFVADLGRMLGGVDEAELILLQLVQVLRLCLLVALPPLLPPDLVQALPEKDDKG